MNLVIVHLFFLVSTAKIVNFSGRCSSGAERQTAATVVSSVGMGANPITVPKFIQTMKISTGFDVGENGLCASCDIKISVNIEVCLGDIWQMPNVRDVIAQSIEPVLKHLRMSEQSIKRNQEVIRYSGVLLSQLEYPYQYDVDDCCIVNILDRTKKYPISDWLEGKLPD